MIGVQPQLAAGSVILCLGAHCDDIEIGCGGTLMELQARQPALRFRWVVFSGDEVRQAETRAAARRLLGPEAQVEVLGFRCSYFPSCAAEIKERFEALKAGTRPAMVFTHRLDDRHQDHRVIAELSWNTFRDHVLLEYEIAKYEGDLGHPNVFVPLSEASARTKVATLMECFPSQRNHTWFDADLFNGLMRVRGVECNAPSKRAEAFHSRKLVLNP